MTSLETKQLVCHRVEPPGSDSCRSLRVTGGALPVSRFLKTPAHGDRVSSYPRAAASPSWSV